ncbi:MAG: hypothetical protein AAEJ43_10245, partial [Gammaproteobacteria bacterium]
MDKIAPDGAQEFIPQRFVSGGAIEARVPNGIAISVNGDILIATFGTNCLEGSVNLTDLGVYLGHARGSKS